jgi:hypothetical protein
LQMPDWLLMRHQRILNQTSNIILSDASEVRFAFWKRNLLTHVYFSVLTVCNERGCRSDLTVNIIFVGNVCPLFAANISGEKAGVKLVSECCCCSTSCHQVQQENEIQSGNDCISYPWFSFNGMELAFLFLLLLLFHSCCWITCLPVSVQAAVFVTQPDLQSPSPSGV